MTELKTLKDIEKRFIDFSKDDNYSLDEESVFCSDLRQESIKRIKYRVAEIGTINKQITWTREKTRGYDGMITINDYVIPYLPKEDADLKIKNFKEQIGRISAKIAELQEFFNITEEDLN